MAISPYFHHISSSIEQDLMTELTRETIYLKGLDFGYIPRDSSQLDELFGEDLQSTFQTSVTLEMYCNEVTGFGGDGDFMSRFGLDTRDEATFLIAKARFTEVVSAEYLEITRPREGDLIYHELTKSLFEITFVEDEKPFFQRGIQTIWECSTKKYEYNKDILETGITDVDDLQDKEAENNDAEIIQSESDDVLNFDESDPFSQNDY